jgi:hypothetical protein
MSKISILAMLSLLLIACASPEPGNSGSEGNNTSAPRDTASEIVEDDSARPDTAVHREDPAMIETCAAKELQHLVGQPESVLETMRFGTVVRIERPGDIHTMEYSAERTRIIIGEDGRIARVICG